MANKIFLIKKNYLYGVWIENAFKIKRCVSYMYKYFRKIHEKQKNVIFLQQRVQKFKIKFFY